MRKLFKMSGVAARPLAAWALGGLLAVAGATGCKQGEGDVCQIDDDCGDGLECNAGTQRCQQPGGRVADAAPRIDAPPAADAAPESDAPAAEPDAAPAPDAGDPDAG